MTDEPKPQDDSPGDFLIYDTPDGNTRIEVRIFLKMATEQTRPPYNRQKLVSISED